MRLRSHLIALVLAGVIPLFIFAAIIVWQDVVERREILERGMQDTVRAMLVAVDGEVRTSQAALETLAASPLLDSGDFAAFHALAERSTRVRRGAYVILFDPSGRVLANSSRPYGAPLPNPVTGTRGPGADPRYPELPVGGGDPVRKVVETGTLVVSDLFISLVTGAPRIGLDIPVMRGGAVRYVLEMSIDAREFTRVLAAQKVPPDTVLAIVDRRGIAVARVPNGAPRVGHQFAPELAAQIAAAPSGSGLGHTFDGVAVYHVFARSDFTGWTTSLSVARSAALAPFTDALFLLAGGAALAILAGLLAALVVGKRITQPIASLTGAAEALARGERPAVEVSAVRELQELHSALVTAGASARTAAEAQAASRAKDEFLAMLSHELRNPLAALTSAAHVLRLADPAGSAATEARRIIERQTKQMTRLVNDLLDISRITLGKLALDRQRLDLGEAVARLAGVWRASGRFERHDVSLDIAPAWVEADRGRIEQITANLLDNALKFTPVGKAIRVTVGVEEEDAVLRVADEGVGLAAETAQRVFDLFVSHDPNMGGLGIGLALVKRLAELHGGAVSVASEGPGRGAAFTVRLPLIAAIAPSEAAPARAGTPARRVLIVEDNDDARLMLAEALSLEGHEVRAARNAQAGLDLAGQRVPDLALIDLRLADMDGYELARRLRGVHGGARIALVALTGLARPEDRQRSLEAGFDAHLVKPVSAERLRQVIAELA